MTNVEVEHDDEWLRERLEIARLLDERYRLREDPDRREDLFRTHGQLSKLLREFNIDVAEPEG